MRVMSRAALVLAATLFATPVLAQTSFNVALGAAVPVGSTADAVDMGYNLTAGIGIKPPLAPLGLRVEGMWNQFGITDTDFNQRVLGVTVNGTLSGAGMPIPMGYLIGGVGMYNSKRTGLPSGVDAESSTDFGFNIGAGIGFPLTGFSTYLEARFHMIMAEGESVKIIPIVFGLKF